MSSASFAAPIHLLAKEFPKKPLPERNRRAKEHLEWLREQLAQQPVSAHELVIPVVPEITFQMKSDTGSVPLGIEHLQECDDAQLVRATIPADSRVVNHKHMTGTDPPIPCWEFLYVESGGLTVLLETQPEVEIRLKKRESLKIPKGVGHVVFTESETVVLAFLAPPDPAYAKPG